MEYVARLHLLGHVLVPVPHMICFLYGYAYAFLKIRILVVFPATYSNLNP